MGAQQFENKVSAKSAREGFDLLVEEAQYESGHGGYTGTIAEKSDYKMVTPKTGESPEECVERCLEDDDHFCQDKWGSSACVDFGETEGVHTFVFFGWASSR